MYTHVLKRKESSMMTIKNNRHSFMIRVAAVLCSETRGKMKYEAIKGLF